MKKSSVLGGLAFAAILGSVFTFPVYAKEKTFPEGIYAGGFALGGLTKEQAETQFAAYISGLEERSVTLDVAGNGLETTAKDLGYACKNEDALQEAEEYAAGGCLIRQYMERKYRWHSAAPGRDADPPKHGGGAAQGARQRPQAVSVHRAQPAHDPAAAGLWL